MKEFWKEIRKPLWKVLCMLIPLSAAGLSLGLFIYYYCFAHSYAQSCVWAVWCIFGMVVYKIKQYEL